MYPMGTKGETRSWTTGLLSRGSQVRLLPGALFLKNSPIFHLKKIVGEHKSNKVISLAISRHNWARCAGSCFSRDFDDDETAKIAAQNTP